MCGAATQPTGVANGKHRRQVNERGANKSSALRRKLFAESTGEVGDVACRPAPSVIGFDARGATNVEVNPRNFSRLSDSLRGRRGGMGMLFDKLWAQVKGAEKSGKLTIEEALDCATRLPQALFCSMMECLAENGEDPRAIIPQVVRLHEYVLRRLCEVAASLNQLPPHGPH